MSKVGGVVNLDELEALAKLHETPQGEVLMRRLEGMFQELGDRLLAEDCAQREHVAGQARAIMDVRRMLWNARQELEERREARERHNLTLKAESF